MRNAERLIPENLMRRPIGRPRVYAYEDNSMRNRETDLGRNYGITSAVIDGMYVSQCGLCAICFRAVPLAYDHDHATGEGRGLLCADCNRAIGLMQDSPERFRAAADYLGRTAQRQDAKPLAR